MDAQQFKKLSYPDMIALIKSLESLSKKSPYKELELEMIDEPPYSDVVAVAMNEFGYIGPTEKRQWLDTYGLGPCLGVHIKSPGTGYQLLMHAVTNLQERARELILYARNKGFVKFTNPMSINSDENITIYASEYANQASVLEVKNALYCMGCNNMEVVTSPNPGSIDVIMNSTGERFWLNPASMNPRFETELDHLKMVSRAFNPTSLYCVNTGEEVPAFDNYRLSKREYAKTQESNPHSKIIKSLIREFDYVMKG